MSRVALGAKILTALVTSLWFLLVYNFTNWLTSFRSDLGVAAFSWEAFIPFVPLAVIPYWSIDLFFVAAPFFIRTYEELVTYRKRIFLAIAIAGTCFILFPLELQFKRPPVSGVLGTLLSSLDNFNNFWNLAPSLHIALRTILWTVYMPRCSPFGRWLLGIWFVSIGLSTILVWQHHLFDLFTGQLLGLFVIQVLPTGLLQSKAPLTDRHRVLALRYLGVAALCVGLFVLVGLPGFILLWPATSFVVVALAYLKRDGRVLGKQGATFSSAGWWLLLPYRLIARAWQHRYGARASRVATNVSFGSFPSSELLRELRVRHIVDLTAEYPAQQMAEAVEYVNIPMLDLVCPSLEQLRDAVVSVEGMSARGSVYIHCALGLSRSALVTAAWLLSSGRASDPLHAMELVRTASPEVIFKVQESELLRMFSEQEADGREF